MKVNPYLAQALGPEFRSSTFDNARWLGSCRSTKFITKKNAYKCIDFSWNFICGSDTEHAPTWSTLTRYRRSSSRRCEMPELDNLIRPKRVNWKRLFSIIPINSVGDWQLRQTYSSLFALGYSEWMSIIWAPLWRSTLRRFRFTIKANIKANEAGLNLPLYYFIAHQWNLHCQ